MEILGIDIGGSGIKGAPVDVVKGQLLTERHRIPTPQPANPEGVCETVAQIVEFFKWEGAIGCGFPGVVKDEIALTAANIDKGWIGINISDNISQKTGCPVHVLNDVDAAGLAEAEFGAGKDHPGVVLVLAFGTGIGSTMLIDGIQIPNTELGHLLFHNDIAERYCSNGTRKNEDLSWEVWGQRVNEYLNHVERLFYPDLIVIGGGVSKYHEDFFPYLQTKADLVPAQLRNNAGIIGAACSAKALSV
ncbi:MAG: polyphosphate--glucose phosphotransferase [Cyclobacteriaceae bacterium]